MNREIPGDHKTVITQEGRIFILGCVNNSATKNTKCMELDLASNCLKSIPSMLKSRVAFGAAAVDGSI